MSSIFNVPDAILAAAARVVSAHRNVRTEQMAKISTGTHQAISRRLHLVYDPIVAQGVPDRLAAIVASADIDPVPVTADSPAVMPASSPAVMPANSPSV
jgi:hypothetical protein